MATIYKISSIPSSTNEYGVGRTESWTLSKDVTFLDREEARSYVIEKNRQHSDMSSLLVGLDYDIAYDFIEEFCFSPDKYLHLRRYFLGKPDQKKIIKAIRATGINVVEL